MEINKIYVNGLLLLAYDDVNHVGITYNPKNILTPYVVVIHPEVNDEGELVWGQGHYVQDKKTAHNLFVAKCLEKMQTDDLDKVLNYLSSGTIRQMMNTSIVDKHIKTLIDNECNDEDDLLSFRQSELEKTNESSLD